MKKSLWGKIVFLNVVFLIFGILTGYFGCDKILRSTEYYPAIVTDINTIGGSYSRPEDYVIFITGFDPVRVPVSDTYCHHRENLYYLVEEYYSGRLETTLICKRRATIQRLGVMEK